MGTLLGFPVLLGALMLQMVVVNRLPLLHGTGDLVLLAVVAWAVQERVRTAWIWALIAGVAASFVSALPMYTPLIVYLVATAISRILTRRVWQTPILALFVAVFLATIVQNVASLMALQLFDYSIPLRDGLSLVTLPSLLLNLVLALPVYVVVVDLANWVYPPLEE